MFLILRSIMSEHIQLGNLGNSLKLATHHVRASTFGSRVQIGPETPNLK